jgi:dephospho-CoA kinase
MVIGIIGGIGSGKSTVLDYLKTKYDGEIIQSDIVAKEIMEPGNRAFNDIARAFPQVIEDGRINNRKLAEIVFKNKECLNTLNLITHPQTIDEIKSRIKKSDKPLVVVESALLIGTGIEQQCDEIWYVFCNIEKRINRLMNSRGYSREKCLNIINNQPDDCEYNTCADEFIDNSDSQNSTYEQIDMILMKSDC